MCFFDRLHHRLHLPNHLHPHRSLRPSQEVSQVLDSRRLGRYYGRRQLSFRRWFLQPLSSFPLAQELLRQRWTEAGVQDVQVGAVSEPGP